MYVLINIFLPNFPTETEISARNTKVDHRKHQYRLLRHNLKGQSIKSLVMDGLAKPTLSHETI